ncbi:MAG: hypothetical protein LBG48_01800 [Rickettsiales bacterium]|nr:hypothetical protein [Rickettsiales bacterium]
MLNNEINTEGLIVSAPIITYSVKGRMIGDNVFTINYEGTTGKVLEMNGLTYNIFTKKVIEIKNLNNNPISSDIQ